MIHDQGLRRVREILADAFGRFRDYYPISGFAKKDGNWHKLNLNQTLSDLQRDKKTKFLECEELEEALSRGITGEFDGDRLTPSHITFPIIKKWILRHKGESQKVTTGPQYEDYERNQDRNPPYLAECIKEVCSWLADTSTEGLKGGANWLRGRKLDETTAKEGLRIIAEDYNPERFAKQKKVLEQAETPGT